MEAMKSFSVAASDDGGRRRRSAKLYAGAWRMWNVYVLEPDGNEYLLTKKPCDSHGVELFLKLAPDLTFIVRPFLLDES